MDITKKIEEELLKRYQKSKELDGYDFWEEHIKYVVKHAIILAKKYNADVEIVELGALLHDIAMPSHEGPRNEHHIYGAKIAEELLTKYNYPIEKIEQVKNCVLNHRGSIKQERKSIEEQCVADADVIAHFDCIPSLFSLAFKDKNLSISEASEFVKNKLTRDFNKLSSNSQKMLKVRYKNILAVLFPTE